MAFALDWPRSVDDVGGGGGIAAQSILNVDELITVARARGLGTELTAGALLLHLIRPP